MIASEICVIAGPRSIGKSRFIDCGPELGDRLPPPVRAHFESRPPTFPMMGLNGHANANLPRATIHADLYAPYEGLPTLPEDRLAAELSPTKYSTTPEFARLADAKRLLVVTLHAPRKVVLNRWLDRLAADQQRVVRGNLARIYSDASGDRLFDRLYAAWYEFLATLPRAEQWRIDTFDAGAMKQAG